MGTLAGGFAMVSAFSDWECYTNTVYWISTAPSIAPIYLMVLGCVERRDIWGAIFSRFEISPSSRPRGAFQPGLGNLPTLGLLPLTRCTLYTPPERTEKAGPLAAASRLDILRSLSTEAGVF